MASKKYLELQDFSEDDLRASLEETQKEYHALKLDHAIKGLDNPLALRVKRRDIARLNSEIRRRELAAIGEDGLVARTKIRARRRKGK